MHPHNIHLHSSDGMTRAVEVLLVRFGLFFNGSIGGHRILAD